MDEKAILQEAYNNLKSGRPTVYKLLEIPSDKREDFCSQLNQLETRGLIAIAKAQYYSRIIQLTPYGIEYIENNFQKKETSNNPNITFSISNVNAPSIIGTQQNPTLNVNTPFDKIKELINSAPIEDRELLNELTETVQSTIEQNQPFKRGMLSRFEEILTKNQDIAVAIWGTIHLYLTKIFN